MPAFRDIKGKKINRLTVIEIADKKGGHYRWKCLCECGKTTIVNVSKIINGTTKSCGCFNRESIGNISRRHGYGHHMVEYNSWMAMKMRCYNLKNTHYKSYGERGIKVCDRWLNSFPNFLSDMGLKPTKQHTLERVEVNGNYGPSNCIWLLGALQGRNKTNNRHITFNGETKLMVDWCRIYDIGADKVCGRLKRGWKVDLRLFTQYPMGYRYDRSLNLSMDNE